MIWDDFNTPDLTGQTIKAYQLTELIGRGSFGEVYRATQSLVNREVAIKIILPIYANHPDFIRRFEAEAQLVARVEHPFIVPLFDYWREPGGAFIVMRWLRGGSLRDLIAQGPLPIDDVTRILDQVASALMVAHQGGVVHRDLKPANILLDERGNAYLADFGIAKDLDRGEASQAGGGIVGSPAYLSPEQVRGEDVTPVADLYSLGVVLYEMLTGQKPFQDAAISALLLRQVNDPLPDPLILRPDLPADVSKIIQRATAKNPKNRYPNVLTLAAAFRRALNLDSGILDISSERRSHKSSFDPMMEYTQEVSTPISVELPAPENPYKGLRAFQESDAVDFFGREGLRDRLIARLGEDNELGRFLAVVGPSGSGKSSVVKAGVMPALRRGALPKSARWFVVEMMPGAYPFEELEAALLRIAVNPPDSLLNQLREDANGLLRAVKRVLPNDEDSELVLVIDQFEEIFTLSQDEAMRQLFMDSLLMAIKDPRSRLRVVITLRADFYDRPLSYVGFGRLLQQRSEVVLPLAHEELALAIAAPAERVGLHLESGLVTEIVADVSEQPAALPLLQYALTELFERRSGHSLTKNAYREIGGISGALARRAEGIYQNSSPEQQAIIRQIFLRLVTLGEGTEDTRRRVKQAELYAIRSGGEIVESVLETFGKYRLLTFDHDPATREPTVEVAHEALIRQWERLRDWIHDLRDDLREHMRLVAAAEEWRRAEQDPSYLAIGARLVGFEEWAAKSEIVLTQREADYLKVSIERREEQLRLEQERQAREEALEQRSRQFLRGLVGVMGVALVVALLLAILAIQARQTAERNADEALAQREIALASQQEALAQGRIALENQLTAQSLALAANARNALNEANPSLALALALEASQVREPLLPEVERILSLTAYGPNAYAYLPSPSGGATSVGISYDGRYAAVGTFRNRIILWDLETRAEVRQFIGHVGPVTSVDFSPDGKLLASAGRDNAIILWDLETGEALRRLEGHSDVVNILRFTPDGAFILSGAGNYRIDSPDNTMRLWEVETGRQVRRYVHLGSVWDIAISADGRYAATVSGSASGTELALPGDRDRRGRVWEIQTGRLIQRFEGFTGLPRAVSFSPNGEQVAIGTWDSANSGTVRVFNVEDGAETRRIFGHTNIITDLSFSRNGRQILSVSWDNSLRIFDLNTGIEARRIASHSDRLLELALSQDGEYILTAVGNIGDNYETDRGGENAVWVWDLQTRSELQRFEGHREWIFSVAYSPDGRMIASGSGPFLVPAPDDADTSIRIWDTETGEQIQLLEGHNGIADMLVFLPDNRRLLSASWDGRIILWDIETGEQLQRFDGHRDRVFSLALHPDGELFVSSSADRSVIEWELESGAFVRRYAGLGAALYTVTYTPDGRGVLTGDGDGQIILWEQRSGVELKRYSGHDNRVERVYFNQDGTAFISASRDGTIRLWDTESRRELRRFSGHVGVVTDAVLARDDRIIVSSGSDTTIRLWDVASGEELQRLEGSRDWVVSVDISPDGQTIVSGGNDQFVRLWRASITLDELRDWVYANRYVYSLDCSAKARYQISDPKCGE